MASLFQGLQDVFRGFFGSSKEEEQQQHQQQQQQRQPGSGFSSGAAHQAKRQRQGRRPGSPPGPGPVLQDAPTADGGGVQGLDWYARSLVRDADGELAHESLDEAGGASPGAAGPTGAAGCRVVGARGGAVLVEPRFRAPAAARRGGGAQQQQPQQQPAPPP